MPEWTTREAVKALQCGEIIMAVKQKVPLIIDFPSHVLEDDFPSLCYQADTTPIAHC